MPTIMKNLSFVAFLLLSAAALSSLYLQVSSSSNISASHLYVYTKIPIILIESIPSLGNTINMGSDTVDAARILLQQKRDREEKAKKRNRVKESGKRMRKTRKRRKQNAQQANEKKRTSHRQEEGNVDGSDAKKNNVDEVKEEVMKNEEEQDENVAEVKEEVMKDEEEQDENVIDVTMADERDDIVWLGVDHAGCCVNCFRMNIPDDDVYRFSMCRIYSHKVKDLRTPLKRVSSSKSVDKARPYLLCKCCHDFLNNDLEYDRGRYDWRNIWPSFYWDLLVGVDQSNSLSFREMYDAGHLWKFIPSTCRRYWMSSIRNHEEFNDCSVHCPPSFFLDRTKSMDEFEKNVKSLTCEGFLRALDPSRLPGVEKEDCGLPSILPDVLCPWGCSEFCCASSLCDPSPLIQHHLRRVQLNLPSHVFNDRLHLFEPSRLDYLRSDDEGRDHVLLNNEWPILPSMRLTGGGMMLLVCRNHAKTSDQRRLCPHLPRKVLHNLSSTRPANLCHAVLKPRSFKSQTASKCGSQTSVRTLHVGYSGADTTCLSSSQSFVGGSRILYEDECLSMDSRQDIKDLSTVMVREKKIQQCLASEWEAGAAQLFGHRQNDVRNAKIGSTYTPTKNAIILQVNASDSSKIDVVVLKKNKRGEEFEESSCCARSWDPISYNLQLEDRENFGWPFRPVKDYDTKSFENTAMLWCLSGMVTSCSDLHHAIDSKRGPHRWNGLSGNLLTHVSSEYFRHRDAVCPQNSPFRTSSALCHVKEELCRLMPEEMGSFRGTAEEDMSLFFRLNADYMSNLFPTNEFTTISVHDSVEDIVANRILLSEKKIFIVVSSKKPTGSAHFELPASSGYFPHRDNYEARVVCAISPIDDSRNFRGIRFARHGDGYMNWQYQQRDVSSKMLMKQYVGRRSDTEPDSFPAFPSTASLYVTVYVKKENTLSDSYRYDLYRSLGMQCQVVCNCDQHEDSPLIVSCRRGKDRLCCSTRNCSGKEKYVCPKADCKTAVCGKCFDHYSKKEGCTILNPPVETGTNTSGDDHVHEDTDNDTCSDEVTISSDCEEEEDDCEEEEDDASVESVGYRCRRDECNETDSFSGDKVQLSIRERMQLSEAARCGNECDEYSPKDIDRMMQEFSCSADVDAINADYSDYFESNALGDQCLPRVNGSEMEVTLVGDPGTFASGCVMFNQVGTHLSRRSNRIGGTNMQQHFVQKLVSSVRGISFPILYLPAMLFPGIFWSSATHDKNAILGSSVISSERYTGNQHGFASSLQMTRNSLTHASSSAATCHNYAAFNYDRQANRAASSHHSSQIARHGFRVSNTSNEGLEIGSGADGSLHESVDSSQMAINLAAASKTIQFDLFLTFTCNQSMHPGIRHLFDWKKSEGWTKQFPDWKYLSAAEREEVSRSFDMAYMSIVSRSWMEVRKLLLQFLIKSSSTILGKVLPAFFRDEYQDESGNLSHIHGLLGLSRRDMNVEEFRDFVCSLQRSAICDLITGDEVKNYIEEGLLKDVQDFKEYTDLADQILVHSCASGRCLVRQGDSGTPDDYKCKKPHPVKDSIVPTENEWIPFNYDWSDSCLEVLKQCELYEEPSEKYPRGRLLSDVLDPKRHMGIVTASTEENLSPVVPQLFALTRSQQNVQILTGTNAISRYVAKYIVKMDAGNRCIVWSDSHTGAVLRAERQFLHNTKITRSAKFEESAHKKSRARNQPVGRHIAFTEMQQQLLGYNDVTTNLTFEVIESKPVELRRTTRIKDYSGKLLTEEDVQMPLGPVHAAREVLGLSRQTTPNQILTLRGSNARYDKVSIFGLRPVELIELFPRIGEYFRWFEIDDEPMSYTDIKAGLREDILKCQWIDGLGRRVRLRRGALRLAKKRLESMARCDMSHYSNRLREYLLDVIVTQKDCPIFVTTEEEEEHLLPIPVFSKVGPEQSSAFLLHIMIMLGEFETELEFRQQKSIKMSLAKCKLIPEEDINDTERLREASNRLLKRIINEVFAFQPITLRRLEMYIIRCKRLLDSVLLDDDIPITDLPPSILTELLNERTKELDDEWETRKSQLLDVMLSSLPENIQVPTREQIMSSTKERPLDWDPVEAITKSEQQSDLSYKEQQASLKLAVRAVNNYSRQFGNLTFTRGVISEGAPGSGKSFVLLNQGLYAMTQGLRVLSTALMAKRSIAVGGGYHLHKLFALECKGSDNPRRLAEIAIDKLHRKSNIKMLHLLMTCDVLLLDELGTLSAQEFTQLDCILRNVRNSNIPFGGVLIFASMDHQQIGTIQGLPVLLSSHIMTDFTLIRLKHSVRAHGDAALQRIQEITRMPPVQLAASPDLKEEFTKLLTDNVNFVSDMNDESLGPEVLRMYSRREQATTAAEDYINSSELSLSRQGRSYTICHAKDLSRPLHSRRDLYETNDPYIKRSLDKKRREPRRLLFHEGAVFEATVNGKGYSQSQVLMMVEKPKQEDIESWADIQLLAAPAKYSHTLTEELPDKETLLREGWTEVTIGVTQERNNLKVTHSECYRKQYTLRHVGASTINKQQGQTIFGPVAIEITPECSPWEKEQVVVMLSRTPRANLIHIAGEKDFAIDKIYSVISKRNQWTDYIESILRNWAIDGDGVTNTRSELERGIMDLEKVFPYKLCNVTVPNDDSGFVYMLMSTVHHDRTYIGQTQNLSIRLVQHNSGHGAEGTAPVEYLPYAPVCYIMNMRHLTKQDRERLEKAWKRKNRISMENGRSTIEDRIDNGKALVDEYNREECLEENKLKIVVCIKRIRV